MSKSLKDLLTITYSIGSNDVYIERSTSPKVKYMGLRALIRKIGQLCVQVTEVPMTRLGRTRFIITNGHRKVWCIELPPDVYSITEEIYVGGRQTNVRRRISLPWTYVIIRDRDTTSLVYCRSAQARSIDDGLCISPLPNISGGNLCLGSNKFESREDTSESKIDWTLRLLFDAAFIGSGYQKDANTCREVVRGIPMTLAEWEARTTKDPRFSEKLVWPEAGISIRNAMIGLAGSMEVRETFITALLEEGGDVS